jgi:predicted dinucleotide-binding enzyme
MARIYGLDRNKRLAEFWNWRKIIMSFACTKPMTKQYRNGNGRKHMKTRTRIGILGTGRMAVRLARLFAECGNEVVLGSRTPERAARIVDGLGINSIKAGSYESAVKAEVVLPSMFLRDGMLDTLEPLRSSFDGKLWIDITNPFNDRYDDFIYPWNTSSAEEIQKRFPRTRVVGAFKNVWWEVFDQPHFDGNGVSDVYVVSDHDGGKREFLDLVNGSPFRYIDGGKLYNARFVERMTLFAAELGQRQGYFPRMNWRLLGEPWSVGKADLVGKLIARDLAPVSD